MQVDAGKFNPRDYSQSTGDEKQDFYLQQNLASYALQQNHNGWAARTDFGRQQNLYPMPPMNVYHALNSHDFPNGNNEIILFEDIEYPSLSMASLKREEEGGLCDPLQDPVDLYLIHDSAPPAAALPPIQEPTPAKPTRGSGLLALADGTAAPITEMKKRVSLVSAPPRQRGSGLLKELAALADGAAAPITEMKKRVSLASAPPRQRGSGLLKELAALADGTAAPITEMKKRVSLASAPPRQRGSGLLKELAALADGAAAPITEMKKRVSLASAPPAQRGQGLLKELTALADGAAAPITEMKKRVSLASAPPAQRGPGLLKELTALADNTTAPATEKRNRQTTEPPAEAAKQAQYNFWTPKEDHQLLNIVKGKKSVLIGWQKVAEELREALHHKGIFRSRTACVARYKVLQGSKLKAAAAYKATKKFPGWSHQEDRQLLTLIQKRMHEKHIVWAKVAAELSQGNIVVRTERACNSRFRLLQASEEHEHLWSKFPKLKTF